MAHITLSIPDEVRAVMREHPEIKWSEIAREGITKKAILLKRSMHSKEFLKLLPADVQKRLLATSDKEAEEFYKSIKRQEWKRLKYLTQA